LRAPGPLPPPGGPPHRARIVLDACRNSGRAQVVLIFLGLGEVAGGEAADPATTCLRGRVGVGAAGSDPFRATLPSWRGPCPIGTGSLVLATRVLPALVLVELVVALFECGLGNGSGGT